MGELGALFNPGMRHEQEEQRAKQMLREEEGTGRKGRLNIDLSSGTVVIGSDTAARRSASADESAAVDGEASGEREASGDESASADRDRSPRRNGSTTHDASAASPARREAPRGKADNGAAQRSSAVPSGKARRHAARSGR